MENRRQNRQFVNLVGNLVESLYNEFDMLPISGPAKSAMVMVMLGDIMQRNGAVISLKNPERLETLELDNPCQ